MDGVKTKSHFSSSADSTPRSFKESVLFCSSEVARTNAKVNGKDIVAILDSGASVSIVNEVLVKPECIFLGREVKVHDWRNRSTRLNRWTNIDFEMVGARERVPCLVLRDVSYDMLVSRPLMRRLRLNLHHDDRVSISPADEVLTVAVKDEWAELRELFPGIICNADEYPTPVDFFKVPFTLKDETPIRRKPYALSRAKQDFVKKELDILQSNGVIRESASPFGSPIILVAKPNGTWRMCTDYRFINDHTDLISWPLPLVDKIIAETGGCFLRSTFSRDFGKNHSRKRPRSSRRS